MQFVGWQGTFTLSSSPSIDKTLLLQPRIACFPIGIVREWFAVFTRHQNEHAVVTHLCMRNVESFLPTYETVHLWKNRVKRKVVLPLFPSYVFVRIDRSQRGIVLSCPGVLTIAGNSLGPIAIRDAEIEFLRSEFYGRRLQPFSDLAIGQKVRIVRGAMAGLEGILVRRQNNEFRFIMSVGLIRQSVSVEIA